MIVQFFYNLLFPFVLLLLLPNFLLRMMRRGQYGHKFGQRFGVYSERVRSRLAAGCRRIWIHAVSVGEIRIALKLLAEIRRTDPAQPVALSTTTSTGYALATKEVPEGVEVLYFPLDFPPFIRAAMRAIRPALIVLVEGEVWPNLTWAARCRGVPVALVNARLSPRSERRFRAFRRLAAPIFNRLSAIAVQERADLARWKSLGVTPGRLHLTGSIKFDYARHRDPDPGPLREVLQRAGLGPETPLLLAGSTHPGEEKILWDIVRELRTDHPTLTLLAAPRHVERSRELTVELERAGARVLRRSGLTESGPPRDRPDVLLLDTTGELHAWYPLATVVFIGKSFLATGGQNPVEAVVAHRPVLFGPHMENFGAIVAELLRHGAAAQVPDPGALARELRRILQDPAVAGRFAEGSAHALAPHSGATTRTVEILKTLAT